MGFVHFTSKSRDDLLEIWRYIAKDKPIVADAVFDKIEAACHRLKDYPKLGRLRQDIAPDLRYLLVQRWLILYRLVEGGVQIVRIIDGVSDLRNVEWVGEI